MVAISQGRADLTTAAASINDPFFFATDPVSGSAFSFDFTPSGDVVTVAEPGTLPLLAGAIGFLASRRRC
jgi:hypothetical protein